MSAVNAQNQKPLSFAPSFTLTDIVNWYRFPFLFRASQTISLADLISYSEMVEPWYWTTKSETLSWKGSVNPSRLFDYFDSLSSSRRAISWALASRSAFISSEMLLS